MPIETLTTVLAVLLSAANLLMTYGRNRAKREEADVQANAIAVQLAQRVPALEQQLRQAALQLQSARAELQENKTTVQELRQIIATQDTAIRRLQQARETQAEELRALDARVQILGEDYGRKGRIER